MAASGVGVGVEVGGEVVLLVGLILFLAGSGGAWADPGGGDDCEPREEVAECGGEGVDGPPFFFLVA